MLQRYTTVLDIHISMYTKIKKTKSPHLIIITPMAYVCPISPSHTVLCPSTTKPTVIAHHRSIYSPIASRSPSISAIQNLILYNYNCTISQPPRLLDHSVHVTYSSTLQTWNLIKKTAQSCHLHISTYVVWYAFFYHIIDLFVFWKQAIQTYIWCPVTSITELCLCRIYSRSTSMLWNIWKEKGRGFKTNASRTSSRNIIVCVVTV